MQLPEKQGFIAASIKTLENLYDMMAGLPQLNITELKPDETALVVVDMINGFAREGALASPRIEALIPEIVGLSRQCEAMGIPRLAFADSHGSTSPEFDVFPCHCIAGSHESELVAELKELGGWRLIPKNSTNGFLEEDFQAWLEENSNRRNFILAGDCTDICVLQFALTLKTWFNKRNLRSRVVVPLNVVDTFELGMHDADLLNVAAAFLMQGAGVELVQQVVMDENQ